MSYTLYHNPRCSTSRFVLQALRDSGIEPEIIEYLKTPPSVEALAEIVKNAGLSPKDIIRKRQKEAADYDFSTLTDEDILNALNETPVLIERPIVVNGARALLARPKETIFEFMKSDV